MKFFLQWFFFAGLLFTVQKHALADTDPKQDPSRLMYEHLLSEYLLARYGPTVQSLPEQAFWPLAIYSVQDSFADGQAGEVELRAVNDNKRALVNTFIHGCFLTPGKSRQAFESPHLNCLHTIPMFRAIRFNL